jgi:hypothetical protein
MMHYRRCHPRLSDAKHREGKGTQVPTTVTVFPTWVPFPRIRYRSSSPGMTERNKRRTA